MRMLLGYRHVPTVLFGEPKPGAAFPSDMVNAAASVPAAIEAS
jgi:hypothetical protein